MKTFAIAGDADMNTTHGSRLVPETCVQWRGEAAMECGGVSRRFQSGGFATALRKLREPLRRLMLQMLSRFPFPSRRSGEESGLTLMCLKVESYLNQGPQRAAIRRSAGW